jgi:PAS domain S-box-containing protein
LLKAALDALPMAAILSEAGPTSSRVLAVNHAFVDLLGWAADELIGMDAATSLYVGPLGVGDLRSTLSSAGQLLEYESQARRKDGGLQPIRNWTRVFQWEGQSYAISTSVSAEEAELDDRLHESEARLQAILDAVPFLFAVVEPDGRFRMVNRELSRQLDLAPEAILGHRVEDVFTPGSAAAMRRYLARMPGGAGLEVGETSFFEGDRELRYRTSCFPLRHRTGHRAGKPYAACLLAIDVTDERATEAALRESDTRFRQLAESIDDAFVLWGGDPPEVLYASPGLPRLYGVDDTSQIPTAGIQDLSAHPDDEAYRMSMFRKRLQTDADLDYEYRIIRADGEVRWLRVHSSRVRIDGKPVDRIATMMSDITDRKLAELELQAARAAAEEANQRKNDFLSRMSHELRTPLNAILGFTQLLELDDLSPDQRSNLRHVASAGHHLLELINDVLDVSRIESGELRLELGPVDLADAVLETVTMLRPQLDDADIELDLPLDSPSLAVRADHQRLVQVLLNLLTNAVKYNRVGGSAAVRWRAMPRGRVRVEVRDDGIGMAAADVERLFTPFERFAPHIQGTGIGLALSRQLVEAMDGSISIDSALGEGTTVTIELPAAIPGPGGGDLRDAAPSRTRVLFAGADRSEVELLRRALELVSDGELVVAPSAREAMVQLARRTPDLVLVDAGLPDRAPEEFVRDLRARAETATVDVIVVAASIADGQRRALDELRANRVLFKPYRLSQLLEAIEEAVGSI